LRQLAIDLSSFLQIIVDSLVVRNPARAKGRRCDDEMPAERLTGFAVTADDAQHHTALAPGIPAPSGACP
jgi:hypothetical protein